MKPAARSADPIGDAPVGIFPVRRGRKSRASALIAERVAGFAPVAPQCQESKDERPLRVQPLNGGFFQVQRGGPTDKRRDKVRAKVKTR